MAFFDGRKPGNEPFGNKLLYGLSAVMNVKPELDKQISELIWEVF